MALAAFTLLPSACGNGGSEVSRPVPAFGVSGIVSGLSGSVLLATGPQQANLSRDALFELGAVPEDRFYDIVVQQQQQQQQQTCIVRNGGGTVPAAVSDIAVLCANTIHAIDGRVEGATGPVTLRRQEGAMLEVPVTGAFNCLVEHEVAWRIRGVAPLPGQTCTVSGGNGVATADVDTARVQCWAAPTAVTVSVSVSKPWVRLTSHNLTTKRPPLSSINPDGVLEVRTAKSNKTPDAIFCIAHGLRIWYRDGLFLYNTCSL